MYFFISEKRCFTTIKNRSYIEGPTIPNGVRENIDSLEECVSLCENEATCTKFNYITEDFIFDFQHKICILLASALERDLHQEEGITSGKVTPCSGEKDNVIMIKTERAR